MILLHESAYQKVVTVLTEGYVGSILSRIVYLLGPDLVPLPQQATSGTEVDTRQFVALIKIEISRFKTVKSLQLHYRYLIVSFPEAYSTSAEQISLIVDNSCLVFI